MSLNKVLVTGGAGYIGSHTCKALSDAGYVPVVYDNLVYGHRWAVKWGPFEEGDISDRGRLIEVFKKHQPVAVIHFAAFAYVGESIENPVKYYRNNVAGTLTLLEAMKENGIDKIVFSSTCATYGMPDEIPIVEETNQQPVNPYGYSKLIVENMLSDFGRAYGLSSIALRYFNAAGADPETEIGEDHDPETHLVPLVLDAASGKRKSITVFGNDYPTSDGTCIRDYIHVTDLADAHVLALRKLEEGAPSDVFNLGNGQGFSVLEVIETAERVTGRKVAVEMGVRRSGDPPKLVADATKAKTGLGWNPRLHELDVIIGTAWDWAKKSHSVTERVNAR